MIRPFLLLTLAPLFAQTDQYQIIFLRPDPERKPLAKEEGERIQAAHMANIHRMAESGMLVAAGPFDDTSHTISGVFFFKMASPESALQEASKDPTVKEHRNTVDVLAWRGPKGIGDEYKRLHAADPKTPEGMGVHPFVMLRKGLDWTTDAAALKDHAAYVTALTATGKLAVSGTVANDANVAEVLIFNRIPDEEAAALVASDPAVKARLLQPEAHRWWSSAHVLPTPSQGK